VHRALTFSKKEPETIEWIANFSNGEDGDKDVIFFDIGANVGIYSLFAARCHRTARIYAFEPDSQSFGSLCKNISRNKFNILADPIAVSNSSGMGSVNLSSLNAGAGACALGENYRFTKVEQSVIFTQGIYFCSIDKLIFEHNFPVPRYIKIDVDGIEQDILRGAENVLKSDLCRSILVEFQYEKLKDLDGVINYLKSFDFILKKKSDWVSGGGNFLHSQNFIFDKS